MSLRRRTYITIPLNPEPWAVGTLGIAYKGRKPYPTMAPNPQLVSFKEAIKEHFEGHDYMLPYKEVEVEFYFWRRLDQYLGPSGRKVTKSAADSTNLQKGLEDALQGILFGNDRYVRSIKSVIMDQSRTTEPMILVTATQFFNPLEFPPDIPSEVQEEVRRLRLNRPDTNPRPQSVDTNELFGEEIF